MTISHVLHDSFVSLFVKLKVYQSLANPFMQASKSQDTTSHDSTSPLHAGFPATSPVQNAT